ncbi:MAG: L,D-transpeptidase family protein [Phycisphaeraceae bacterium]
MVLSSQSGRPGSDRRYMVSRRRRKRRWPWVVIALAGLGIAGWIAAPGGGDEKEAPAAEEPSPAVSETASQAGSGLGVSDLGEPERLTWADPKPDRPASNPGSRQKPAPEPQPEPAARTAPAEPREQVLPDRLDPAPTARSERGPVSSPPPAPTGASQAGAAAASVDDGPLKDGMDLLADGKWVEGRRVLSEMLFSGRLSPADARKVRDTLTSVNDELIFSDRIVENDPLVEEYRIQRGDLLYRIAGSYNVTAEFLEQINNVDARRLHVGQQLKLVRGPFHALIDKSAFRMDVYLRDDTGSPIYARSFEVGLGEGDSTPAGQWIVAPGRKVTNPDWRNPRTREYFDKNDPDNPIGEYWLALKGVGPDTKGVNGYGIHGTIDPESVGQQMSMGCVRLRDADIEQVYRLLVDNPETQSTVQIVP